MSQFNNNSYAENDCEEELAGGIFLTPILPSIKPNNGSIMDRSIKKAKRHFDKKENIAPKRVCTEENLTLLPDEDSINKRGQVKDRVLNEINKTISLDMIPRDYKFRMNPPQVIYIFIL